MRMSRVAKESLLKEANDLLGLISEDKVASKRQRLSSAGSRIAINIIRDPEKIKKQMEKLGVALDYDGSVWSYPFGNLGFPNIMAKPRRVGMNIEKAVRANEQTKKTYEVDIVKYDKLRDALAVVKKYASKDDVDGALDAWADRVVPNRLYKTKPRSNAVKSKADTHYLIMDVQEALLDGDSRGAIKAINKAYNALDVVHKRSENMLDIFQEQRKIVLAVRKAMSKDENLINDLASIGTPPRDGGEVNNNEPMKVKQGSGLVRDIETAIVEGRPIEFEYTKMDGSSRDVNLLPDKVAKAKNGVAVYGYDIDKGAKRMMYLDGIS